MKKISIYVVDDDDDDLESISDAINALGCADDVYLSHSIPELFAKLNDESFSKPDLIVLDHQTPGTNGGEALQMLRKDPRNDNTAIVVYSTHITAASQEILKQKGADLCLAKGLTMGEIRSHVQAFCTAAEKRKQAHD